ncbi:hypothetical protein MtrunA17_Chr2g0290051 [Medicago truncatula]|uniref:Uncharacterized protein n=1 Tax=Medicago truncatula TaxID=3880 RepID=A0A396JBW0_MEDTR|nr:hypothetical protein MtrunA17_Chr2g0290051 [Medicago truncatula]
MQNFNYKYGLFHIFSIVLEVKDKSRRSFSKRPERERIHHQILHTPNKRDKCDLRHTIQNECSSIHYPFKILQTKQTNSITRNNLRILFQLLHITDPSFQPLQSQFKSSGQEVVPVEKNESHRSKFNDITKIVYKKPCF